MASILRRSLKEQLFSAARITTTSLTKPIILSSKPTVTSPLANHQDSTFLSQIPTFLQQDSNSNVGFYPSFCFGNFLNPVSFNGLILTDEDNSVADQSESKSESNKIWADSVKKKRKRKMNKHKLKKLRKRLRRKTKT